MALINLLIYATSNRRHLIKETFADKEGRRDQLHSSDTVRSQVYPMPDMVDFVHAGFRRYFKYLHGQFKWPRINVTIFFCAPDKRQFQEIVSTLAERSGIGMPKEELLLEANKWELSHGGLSGRTAQQFIDYLLGKGGGWNENICSNWCGVIWIVHEDIWNISEIRHARNLSLSNREICILPPPISTIAVPFSINLLKASPLNAMAL